MHAHDPFEPVVIWQSPDWRPDGSEDAPASRHDWDELLEQCRSAVARRERAYPQLVRDGRMEAADARCDLDAWLQLAAEWHWIISGEGEAPGLHTLADRIAAVRLATERLEGELARGRRTEANLYQHQLLRALAWHLGDGTAQPAIHHTARLNHAWRAEQAASAMRSAA